MSGSHIIIISMCTSYIIKNISLLNAQLTKRGGSFPPDMYLPNSIGLFLLFILYISKLPIIISKEKVFLH